MNKNKVLIDTADHKLYPQRMQQGVGLNANAGGGSKIVEFPRVIQNGV